MRNIFDSRLARGFNIQTGTTSHISYIMRFNYFFDLFHEDPEFEKISFL